MRYLSLGAGVQSTAMLILSVEGKIPWAHVAIFADTQDEPSWVYENLERLESWSKIPILRVTNGCLSADVIARHRGQKKRSAAIPVFTMGADGRAAPLNRHCTRDYKIVPIERKVKELLGYKKGQVVKKQATAMIGISLDEMQRMRVSRTRWITNEYPLIDLRMTRRECSNLVEAHGFPRPKKSSCVFCPYHDDTFWEDLRDNHPDEFKQAVDFDIEIRDMSMSGLKQPAFLHRSLKPLSEVEFNGHIQKQMRIFYEDCEGMCGV